MTQKKTADKCDGCYEKFFADAWTNFITYYCQIHEEFVMEFTKYHIDKKTDYAKKIGLVKPEKHKMKEKK